MTLEQLRIFVAVAEFEHVTRAAEEVGVTSAGNGTKGPRLHDWAYCEFADLDAAGYDEERSGLWTRGLLIRRTISDGDLAFFTT